VTPEPLPPAGPDEVSRGLLRVLHVMTRMSTGGTERQLVGMLRAAHGRLWDAHLVVLHPGFPLAEEAAEFMPVTELRAGPGWDPRRPRALRRLVRDLQPDVVHPSLWGASWFTRLCLVGPGRPAMVMSERSVEDFRPRTARLLDAALRPVTDAYIGNSQDVVAFIRRAHGAPAERVACIRNGLDGRVFHPRTGPRAPGGPRIGSVGRLIPSKLFDVAIAAMPAVLAAVPDATLRIAGEGPEREALLAAAEGLPVELVGLLSSPASVAEFLRDLDVFAFPSAYEGLPNVVLEAQACGLPVVATDVTGMAEAAGPTARLVPAGDDGALAAAILETLGSADADAALPARTFEDVAAEHLVVFEAARVRRAEQGGRPVAAGR
jgi:glycosyltransferase involved in cell wall biosynthesis